MPNRDLVLELSGEDPTNALLAVLDNAKAGHYAAADDESLARDLEALTFDDPKEHADAVRAARAGEYRASQESIATDPELPRTDPAPAAELGRGASPSGLTWPPKPNAEVPPAPPSDPATPSG